MLSLDSILVCTELMGCKVLCKSPMKKPLKFQIGVDESVIHFGYLLLSVRNTSTHYLRYFVTTEHPLDGNLSLFHPSGSIPGGYFMAAQHPLDREFALFHQADFLSRQRHFFELSERILQALQTAALVFHHGWRRQQLQWRRNLLELTQRLVQTQQTARMQRQAKLALRQRPHQMQTIHVHDFGRLDRDHAVGVPGPRFELPSVFLVVSTIVRMAWTLDRRQTHTIEHPRLQFLAPIRSCRCRRRRRACTTSRVRPENPVPVGPRGDSRLARDERHGAVMVGRSAELARQACVLVIVRQDEAEVRSQPAVVVDGMVGVGDVEEELPGFRRVLGKSFAAVEAVEAVVGGVGGERHC